MVVAAGTEPVLAGVQSVTAFQRLYPMIAIV